MIKNHIKGNLRTLLISIQAVRKFLSFLKRNKGMRKMKLEEYKNMKTRSLILKGKFHHFSSLLPDEYTPTQTNDNKSIPYKTIESDLFLGKVT